MSVPFKMKGSSFYGRGNQSKSSPAKQSAGGMTIDRDRDQKLFDGLRSKKQIEKRHQKNTLGRAEGERKAEAADAGISKEQATQRRHNTAHRDATTGDWKA